MAGQLASFEADREQYQEQLDVILAALKDDPDNTELNNLQNELTSMISLLDESITELKPKQALKPAAPSEKKPTSPPPEKEKWPRQGQSTLKAAAPSPADDKDDTAGPVSYQVNDNVLAKWVSGDKAFYPARIASITGSSTAPIYIVKFKTYDNTETLRAKDIRPVSNKRKADGTPASTATTTTAPAGSTGPAFQSNTTPTLGPTSSSNGVVTSASASLYPEQKAKLEAERKAAEAATIAPPKPKKIKATKELEKGKSKWQEFNSKSKFGKSHKKDSMFRTPEGVHGRVGFTGSGQAMRKDPTRSRHVYQQNDDAD